MKPNVVLVDRSSKKLVMDKVTWDFSEDGKISWNSLATYRTFYANLGYKLANS